MKRRHIAFFLDQAYGNIIPSLGIAMKLLERGHEVTYVVAEGFASLIKSIGAAPVVVDFLKTRQKAISELMIENDHEKYRHTDDVLQRRLQELIDEQTQHTLTQVRASYVDRTPDLVIHDDSMNESGRAFARQLNVPKIRLATQYIEEQHRYLFANDETILVTIPEFFQPRLDVFKSDARFKFTGFTAEGRCLSFRPWTPLTGANPRVLVSPTTGQLPQIDFCRRIVEIFQDQAWDIVLSISGAHDKISTVDPDALGRLSDNVHINRVSGNFEIMQNVDLYIGQAGQGGTLEAIYWGLPQILIPPTPYHAFVAKRVDELGLGVFLPIAQMSRETLIGHATTLLNSKDTAARIEAARASMRDRSGSELAATMIEEHLN